MELSVVGRGLVFARTVDQEMVPRLKIATGESPFVPAILIVSQEPSVEVDGAGTRVVNLNPVGVLTIVILQRGIVGLDL